MRNDPNMVADTGFREAIEMAKWRVSNLMSKSAFARAIGSTPLSINDFESGRQRVTKRTYDKFCAMRDLYKERTRGVSAARLRYLKVYGVLKPPGRGKRSPWTKENNPLSKYWEEKKRQEALSASTERGRTSNPA